ncbi:MAG: NUDIX domain-containing protein [Candidatus Methanofastidiosia archaeon]
MKKRDVVTCFLKEGKDFLVVRRSEKVSSYPNKWAGISGSIEDETMFQAAYREVEEETGITRKDLQLVRVGSEIYIPYRDFTWVVHPVLLRSRTREVRLNWENSECKWLSREEIGKLETVPGLVSALDSLLAEEQ